METPEFLPEAATDQLTAVFEPDEDALLPSRSLADVRAYLEAKITNLLSNNPILLMSLLYRIDVPERDVKLAFLQAPSGELASELADLIIQRQLQKVRIRRSFGKGV